MSHRDEQQPQDVQKMCKQAERDHESRKLVVLIERVKRQLREREQPAGAQVNLPKPPVAALSVLGLSKAPMRSFFER
jgi:hypothetical protein